MVRFGCTLPARKNIRRAIMAHVSFIHYKDLKEFYTISEVCKLFNMKKARIRKKCEKYGIKPRRNKIGEYGFVKYDVRKLHNRNAAPGACEDDLWA